MDIDSDHHAHRCTVLRMHIRPVPFDHPDAVKLNDQVQAEYAERYGDGGDATHLDARMFAPPLGLYLIAYDERDRPVATGGWRTQDENDEGYTDGDAPWRTTPARPAASAWSWRPAASSPRRSPSTRRAATSRAPNSATTASTT
jgi:hypothetical protein